MNLEVMMVTGDYRVMTITMTMTMYDDNDDNDDNDEKYDSILHVNV